MAHSWPGGDIHFDEDENYRQNDLNGVNLLKVAVHEVGHVLGLLHNDKQHSIMFPIYIKPEQPRDFELVRDDRTAVQEIYGVCKGSFDVLFDWLRRQNTPAQRPTYIFNTYFFRDGRFWMYENRYNRTRYGDPLSINEQWRGLTPNIDAFTQVIRSRSPHQFDIDTYFFKGQLSSNANHFFVRYFS